MKINPISDWDYYEWGTACAVLCILVAICLLGLATHYGAATLIACAGLAALGALVALRVPPSGLALTLVAALVAATAISASRAGRPIPVTPPQTRSTQDAPSAR